MKTKRSAKSKWTPTPKNLISADLQEQLGDMEGEAKELVKGWDGMLGKLEEFEKPILSVQKNFKQIRKWGLKVTLLGCRTFQEFCRVKLHRSEQAIYAMLAKKQKPAKKQPYNQARVLSGAARSVINAAVIIHKRDKLTFAEIRELIFKAVAAKAADTKGADFIAPKAKGAAA